MEPPRIGSVVFLDDEGSMPVIVVNRIGTTLYLVQAADLRTTHQGNVYNQSGEREWMV